MTRQIEDLIDVDGEQRLLRGWPLEEYWRTSRKTKPEFPPISTNCFRGYRAVWFIDEGRLFLKSVGAGAEHFDNPSGGMTITRFIYEYLPSLFPDQEEPIFGAWVSGEFYTETTDKTKAEMLLFKKGILKSRQPCKPFDPYLEHRKRMAEIMKDMDRRQLH